MAVASTSYFPQSAGALTTGQVTTTEILDGTVSVTDLAAMTDVTTLNASTTAHGLSPKATAPAAGLLSVLGIGNGETVRADKPLFDTTNPAALGTVGPGSQLVAARRDHVHPNPAIDTLAAATDILTLNSSSTAHGLLPKLSNTATEFMNGVGSWATPAGVATRDANYYRQVGTSPLASWYSAQMDSSVAMTTKTVANDVMWAIPFLSVRGGTLDRIGFEVTTQGGVGSVTRAGIYSATSATNLYPDALLVESGSVNTQTASTGTITAVTINQALAANTLYWFVLTTGVEGSAQFRAHAGASLRPYLGSPATGGANFNVALTVSRAFAALPATFTAGAAFSIHTTTAPAVFVRYSA